MPSRFKYIHDRGFDPYNSLDAIMLMRDDIWDLNFGY